MDAPLMEIRPDVKKAFLGNVKTIAIVSLLVVFSYVFLDRMFGMRLFLDIFAEFGIKVSIGQFWLWFFIFLGLAMALSGLANYVALHHQAFTIYSDKIVVQKPGLFSTAGKIIELPFSNIASISLKAKSFPSSSSVILQVSGKEFDKLTLDFVDDGQALVDKLHSLVQQHRGKVFTQLGHEYRVGQIAGGY